MGLFGLFKKKPLKPQVSSILPDAAKQEIMSGRLPILRTGKVFLKKDEQCHYIEKAIFEKKTIRKRYVRKNSWYSTPGFFSGSRIGIGGGHTDVKDNVQFELLRGILYITNKRILFVGEASVLDKKIEDLVAIKPYTNCIELQFSKENCILFVPDGNIACSTLRLIK